ncbi:MAG TPA: helix-turn-helix domain-containing protein [Kiritimatiellia bacterium]|nr:helix-turn-helix domain-containing protein [Kiritimatiellia bacterium]HMP32713.1 helix-turn-helix domain-containing protein [Kiritimatiellia bacterium]
MRTYREGQPATVPTEPSAPVAPRSDSRNAIRQTVDLLNAGRTVEEAAEERGIKVSSVIRYVEEALAEGLIKDPDRLMNTHRRDEIAAWFASAGSKSLSAVVQASGGAVGFEEARLARAILFRK